MLRFLWFQDPLQENSKLLYFRFTRLVFGFLGSGIKLGPTCKKLLSEMYKVADPSYTIHDFSCAAALLDHRMMWHVTSDLYGLQAQ